MTFAWQPFLNHSVEVTRAFLLATLLSAALPCVAQQKVYVLRDAN